MNDKYFISMFERVLWDCMLPGLFDCCIKI